MAHIVPDSEDFGNEVPMDPTIEHEDSENSEEFIMSEAPHSNCHVDDVGDNEEATESLSDFAESSPVPPKYDGASSTSPLIPTSSNFDWNSYLREQQAEPAPRECFFQPDEPSENKFQIGMKLMIADPRGPSGSSAMFCLGTIVNVYKLWLCVRLEGLDNSHEKWIFCDDDSIQPIGHTAEDHMKLNPPIGFIHHHGTFPKFLEQHLKPDDETGESLLCPLEWFKPISESLRPAKNFFRVGQKVEAIDQRSFNGKTCPATIAAVTKTHIQIHFDGWNSGYDIKEPYYTRFVMPVGWSQKNGIDISPPKSEAKIASKPSPLTVLKQPTIQKQKQRPNSTKSTHQSLTNCNSRSSSSTSKHVVQRLSDMGVNQSEISKGRGKSSAKRPHPTKNVTATPPPKKSTERLDQLRSTSSAEVPHLSKTDSERTMVNESSRGTVRKSRSSENSVEDKVKDLLMHAKVEQQRLAKQLLQPAMAYLSSPKIIHSPPPLPLPRLETSPASVAFYAPIKNETEEVVSSTTASVEPQHPTSSRSSLLQSLSAQINRDHQKLLREIHPKIQCEDKRKEKSEEASTSSSTPPLSVHCGVNYQRSHDIELLSKDEVPLEERLMTIFVNYSCNLGPHLNPAMVAGIRRKFGPFATHHALREAVQQLLNCSTDDSVVLNLVQPAAVTQILSVTAHCGGTPRSRFIPCVKSSADAWNYLKQLLRKMKICENFYSCTSDPCNNCVPTTDLSLEQVIASSQPIRHWTIGKVANELRKLLEPAIVSKFVEQQIDGRSLVLLTTDLLMSHMGLALGPALKVVDFVNSVRKAQENQ